MPKKIKVVDVVNNDETLNNTFEQPIIEKQEQIITAVETTPITDIETESTEVKEEDKPTNKNDKPIEEVNEKQKINDTDNKTKTRTQELHECPKCHKFMTLKTLKYVHQNTCPVKDPPKPKAKGRPKKIQYEIKGDEITQIKKGDALLANPPNTPEESVQNTFIPHPKQAPILNQTPVKSFEEMRKDRLIERVNLRKQRISNLLLHAF